MTPGGFKTTISAGERPQTYALENAATGTGKHDILLNIHALLPDLCTDMILVTATDTRTRRGTVDKSIRLHTQFSNCTWPAVPSKSFYFFLSNLEPLLGAWEVLKCGAVEGWKKSV